jgi:hypothetical protein
MCLTVVVPRLMILVCCLQCSIGNGATAILAGVIAQVLEDSLGHIGPFQGAIALTVFALVLILRWEENYGESKEGDHGTSSVYRQFTDGWKLVANDSKVLRIGLIQALSEGGMYTVSLYTYVLLLCLCWYPWRLLLNKILPSIPFLLSFCLISFCLTNV